MAPDDADDLKKRLRMHDQMYASMQQQGKPFEALEHLEKGLFVRKELFGPEHPEVGRVCQVFTTSCNTLAMNSLQRGNPLISPVLFCSPRETVSLWCLKLDRECWQWQQSHIQFLPDFWNASFFLRM